MSGAMRVADGIVLIGMPGSGKTVIGRVLAERLKRPFVDLDEEITRTTGNTPANHIRRHGEAAFRELESRILGEVCRTEGTIIATGGGTPLDPLNRWAFARHGLRIRLDVPIERLAQRLRADPVPRPLLGDQPAEALTRLAAERGPFYRAVDAAVDGDAGTPAVAAEIVRTLDDLPSIASAWRPLYDAATPRHHPIGPQMGRVVMGTRLTATAIAAALEPFAGRVPAVVADGRALAAAPALAGALPADRLLELRAGEDAKRFRRLEQVLIWLNEQRVERGDPLLAVGGGTVGDLAGLAAALHHRGTALVHVPTTWLAQADSAIGGKVAIDLPAAKNAVGAIWPAWLTLSDISVLGALPAARRRDGLAECLKAGLIGDRRLWDLVERRGKGAMDGTDEAARYAITERAAHLKLGVVERDPYEAGERRTLNLGHTIGHALEVESGYRLAHGTAVALGLRAVAAIAARRGAEPGLSERLDDVLSDLGFPLRRGFDPAAVIAATSTDKKRHRGVQRWILPMGVGHVEEVADVSPTELHAALRQISSSG